MSDEQHHDTGESASGIKTPQQLIMAIVAAFVIPIVVIFMLTMVVSLNDKSAPGTRSFAPSVVAQRIAPIGEVRISDPTDIAAARTGEQVFNGQCTSCHTAGLLGAPKLGDATAWGPRLRQGFNALWNAALHGKGNMPAQNGGDASDFEIARAVVYMANRGGAALAEPKPPSATASSAAQPPSSVGP